MKKLFNLVLLACIMVLASCSSDIEDFQPGVSGDKITIGVGMPGADTRVSTADLLNMTWEDGDKLYIVGYDNNNSFVGSVFGYYLEGAGQKFAKFETYAIEGASKYKVYYYNKKPKNYKFGVSFNGEVVNVVGYLSQEQNGLNNSENIKSMLILSSDIITEAQLKGGVRLAPRNSILRVNIKSVPAVINPKNQVYSIDWIAGDKNPAYLMLANDHGGKMVTVKEGQNNYFYMAFDPFVMPEGAKVKIKIDGNEANAISVNGRHYKPGKIYNITLGYKEDNSWGLLGNPCGVEEGDGYVDPVWGNKTFWVYGLQNMPEYETWPAYDVKKEVPELDWDRKYGWYDCLKLDPTGPHDPIDGKIVSDHRLCWAAATSNMLHWWMDRNAENIKKYNQIMGEQGYNGPSAYYPNALQSEIFQFFKDHFNDHGGHGFNGLDYFFKGKPVNYDGSISHGDHNGFFRDVILDDSYLWRRGTAYTLSDDLKKAFLNHEAIYIGVKANDGAHAITIWGAKFDNYGNVCQIYVADNNDNEMSFDKSIKDPFSVISRISAREVKNINGSYWLDGSARLGDFKITIYDTLFLGTNEAEWKAFFKKHNM